METKEANKGTGAGGAMTNENGIKLEERVRDIFTYMFEPIIRIGNINQIWNIIKGSFKGDNRIFFRASEHAFRKWDIRHKFSVDINEYSKKCLHGAKEPDDAFIDMNNKVIYWIECKVQKKSGSKCEVLQTYNLKIRNLKERYPEYTINYIYVLDQNLRQLCPKEISYMEEDNIRIVWDDDPEFEKKLLNVLELNK